MSQTIEDLKAAFAGESQANRRYLAFAKKADEEGYPQIARLFRAVAAAETVHALSHFRIIGGVNATAENLKTAIAGENYEHTTMYPEFLADAEKEENKKAYNSMKWAMEVEMVHEQLYKEALDCIQTDWAKSAGPDYYVCPFCGFTHAGSAPEKCPVCGTPGKRFERIS